MKTQTKEISSDQQEANDLAKKHGIKLTIISHEWKKHFADDKQERDVYKCRLSRKGKQYTFEFGQSIANAGQEPTLYDVLSCLQKYEVGDFENFCADFGYHPDSRKAEKTYHAVVKEWKAVERLFSDILEELQEIQ